MPDDGFISQRTKAIVRQQALRAMAYGPDGRLTKNARLVIADLARFCDVYGAETFPTSPNGPIDPLAMARVAGRREVFNRLERMLNLKLEDRHNSGDVR